MTKLWQFEIKSRVQPIIQTLNIKQIDKIRKYLQSEYIKKFGEDPYGKHRFNHKQNHPEQECIHNVYGKFKFNRIRWEFKVNYTNFSTDKLTFYSISIDKFFFYHDNPDGLRIMERAILEVI
jgi:hypothetical protein